MELRRCLRVRLLLGLTTVAWLGTAVFGVLAAPKAEAAQTVPYKINFQGRLTDNSGNALSDGLYNVKFRLYDALTVGALKYTEDRIMTGTDNRIQVTNGLFNIQFGDLTSLSPALFNTGTGALYLEVELPTPATATCATNGCAVFTEGAMTPRQPLASGPYAFNSDTFDGLDSTAFAQLTAANTFTGANLFAPTTAATVALTVKATTAGSTNALEVFDSGGTRQAFFDATGKLNVAQTVQPTSNNTVDIGAAATAFKSGYFGTSVVSPLHTGAGAVTLSSGGAADLTLDSASGILQIAGADTTLKRVGSGTYTIDLSDAGATTLAVTNSAAGVASLSVDGNVAVGAFAAATSTFVCSNAGTLATCTATPAATLQASYVAGSTISTTGTDIGFTLNTSQNFTVATATGATGATTFSLTDGANATPPAQLVLVRNNDVNQALASGVKVTSAAGGITTAFDGSGTGITNALAIGTNAISGTNFSVAGTGAVTSVGLNAGTGLIQGTGGFTGTGTVQINATGAGTTAIGSAAAGATGVVSGSGLTLTGATATLSTTTGNLVVQSSANLDLLSTAAAGVITLGNSTTSQTLNIGTGTTAAGNTQAINIGTASTGTGNTQVVIGNTNGTSGLDLASGSGGTNLVTNSATGGTVVQSATNSTAAFQVQNAIGAPILLVDTTTPNLVTNPGFEVNTTGWAPTGTGAAIAANAIKANAYNGLASLRVTTGTVAGTGVTTTGLTGAPLAIGTYTLSFYAMASGTSFSTLAASFSGGGTCTLNTVTVLVSGFQQYSCTVTTASTSASVKISTTDTTSHIFYLDSVQIVAGSVVVPYNIGNIQLRGIISNPATFQSSSNSTTALQVTNAAGTSALNVDTLNSAISTGNTGTNGTWNSTTALPTVRFNSPVVYANGYVYIVNGATAIGTSLTQTIYAKVNANGTIGAWNTATATETNATGVEGSAVYNNYIYSVGGINSAGTVQTATTFTKLNQDGNITQAWLATAALPTARWESATIAANGYLYSVGGTTVSGGAPTAQVYYAKINADGSLGAWTTSANPLSAPRNQAQLAVVGNTMYVIGGNTTGAGAPSNQVYTMTLNPTTGLNSAETLATNTLPGATVSGVAGAMNGYMYYVGGDDGTNPRATVYYAKILPTGLLGTWATSPNSLPQALTATEGFFANGYMYTLGGSTNVATTAIVANTYYASGPRVSIAANLDLLGSQSGGQLTGNSSGVGGSIYAGDIYSQGSVEVTGNTRLWGGLGVTGASNFSGDVFINNAGLCVKSTAAACVGGFAAGKIISNSGAFTGADFAENYISSQVLKPGEAVKLAKDGHNAAIVRTTRANDPDLIGVVSSAPGVTINADAVTDASHSHLYPIALMGRVPVQVCNINGRVHAGDMLTPSAIPGVAMKATSAGQTLGRALEDAPVTPGPGTPSLVTTYMNLSWYDPSAFGTTLQSATIAPAGSQAAAITGSSPAGALLGTADLATNLKVAGDAVVGGNLITAGDITAKDLAVTGTVTAAGITTSVLSVSGDATLSGGLNVAGPTALANLAVGGEAVLANLAVAGDTALGGHLKTVGQTPTITASGAAGKDATASISGTDLAGTITITTGSAGLGAGALASISFAKSYSSSPNIVVSPHGSNAALLGPFLADYDASHFSLGVARPPAAKQTYVFTYIVVESQVPDPSATPNPKQ